MKGDFSRDTFDPEKHYIRVLMQQGRVQLDSDWNEAGSITVHYLRSLAGDLIGSHGGPGGSFRITPIAAGARRPLADLGIGPGHYYVTGLLCENRADDVTYHSQQNYPVSQATEPLPPPPFLVYLDVWERHITVVEDGNIREPALGGPDTCTRAQVVWQIKVLPLRATTIHATGKKLISSWRERATSALQCASSRKATLRARAHPSSRKKASGGEVGGGGYQGLDNRLYRVEIHEGGHSAPSFKWSRANGSVVFPIRTLLGNEARVTFPDTLESNLRCGDWVEVADDVDVLLGRTCPLLQVVTLDSSIGVVTLSEVPPLQVKSPTGKHPLLRRWEGWQPIQRPSGSLIWQDLEDGVQIQFGADGDFRAGDYWRIPARVATGDVIWPMDSSDRTQAAALPPAGVEHNYAPLSVLLRQKNGSIRPLDLRRVFKRLAMD